MCLCGGCGGCWGRSCGNNIHEYSFFSSSHVVRVVSNSGHVHDWCILKVWKDGLFVFMYTTGYEIQMPLLSHCYFVSLHL